MEKNSFFCAYFYEMLLAFSALGGTASYLRKVRLGFTKKFSLFELTCEIVISLFVGAVTLFLCDSQGIDKSLTGALTGLAGHLGSRAIYFFELFLSKKSGVDMSDRRAEQIETEFKRRASDEKR